MKNVTRIQPKSTNPNELGSINEELRSIAAEMRMVYCAVVDECGGGLYHDECATTVNRIVERTEELARRLASVRTDGAA